MLLSTFCMITALWGGLSVASSDTLNSTLLVPTQGQTLYPTGTAIPTTTHRLGGTAVTSLLATSTAIPVDWSSLVTSNFPGPAPLNQGANVTFSNMTAFNQTFSNITTIIPRSLFGRMLHGRGPPLPAVVDWRNRWGLNWITTIQDQGGCESCWAFAATALMETMVRIQHGMWSKRSEADVHDGLGVSCATGGSAQYALSWAAGTGAGVSDEVCLPYPFGDENYEPCADRSGRALRVPAAYTFAGNSNIQDQKTWIYNIGPLTADFDVHKDFDSWNPSKGVYKWDGVSPIRGRHVVLIVGYDDNRGCWIIKNSWGSYEGDKGYYYIGYGQVTIDSSPKTGITNVNPDAFTRRRHHNGNMYQGGNGATHRNFELVRSDGAAGIKHVYRNGGENGDYSWHVASHLRYTTEWGTVVGDKVVGQPVITGTSFNRNFEMLYWESTGWLQHWYLNQIDGTWYSTGQQGNGQTAGYPGFIQTADSNFAVVVRNTDGSLYEYKRTPSSENLIFQNQIATNVLQSGPALVQSNIGNGATGKTGGILYVVAVLNTGQMQIFSRDPSLSSSSWTPGEKFGASIPSTPPVMIQSYWSTADENTAGPFELCIAVGGQVQHWQWYPPTSGVGSGSGWQHVYTFGGGIRHVWSLVHGSFNQALEMVVENTDGSMAHWHFTNSGWAVTATVP